MLVVAAALVDGEGRVLVQRRPPGKSLAGLWEFPGGKPESGESPELALVRELREELGIEVSAPDLTAAAFASEALGERHLILLLYLCRGWTDVPKPLHATELRWVTLFELRQLAMPPADLPLITALEKLL
ncbi:(deoxy)nucleoside triphosphate pyrophosphohydrolase [Sphingomonas sp.]|uniref:(deoxy)nucleoside triphosphate pyrophosphohydrolase n=1 Tax=Sphingomonas sp. TaxID=28214 RepID=UPI0025E9568B|nr:(deoxy)nucleoside triphosphate pyrophosphohydrolase [Sphingomonas sp.]